MFGKIFKSINNSSIKNSNMDLSSLKNAKNTVESSQQNKTNQYYLVLSEGIVSFKKFIESNNEVYIKDSIKHFTNAIEIKKSSFEPYYYLSYIAYICKDFKVAQKYIDIADYLKPEFSRILELKEKIKLKY